MKAYLDFLAVIMMTACTVAIVGLLVAGGYMLYKTIKEEF
jgi:hypothetical protein